MDAAITVQRQPWTTWPALGLGHRLASWWAVAVERISRLSWRRRAIAATALTVSLAVATWVAAGPETTAYLGVFGLIALANAVLFLPSGRGAVMVAGALALDPLAVGIIAVVGGALGELTGYAFGRSSHRLVRRQVVPHWLASVCRPTHGRRRPGHVRHSKSVHGRYRYTRRQAPLSPSTIPDIHPGREGGPVRPVRVPGAVEHLSGQLPGRSGDIRARQMV